jgi:CheY-like chemotaxis protein
MRILIFEDDNNTRKLLDTFLMSKGYEVLSFSSPITCELLTQKKCACPRQHACADAMITDMNMPGMSGLELVRFQMERACHAPPQNKAVISAALTPAQEQEFRTLGCRCFRKPFKLSDLLDWVRSCEANIPKERELEPIEELWKTAARQQPLIEY